MLQIFKSSGSGPAPDVETISGEGGAAVPPAGFNFNFSGSVAGGSVANGAILFSTPANGQVNAVVQTDGTSITINASNKLQVVGDVSGTAVTTDGTTPVTIITIPMTAGTSISLDGILSGFEATTPAAIGSSIIATLLRGSGGLDAGAQLVAQSDDEINASPGLTTATYAVTPSGNNILITVTGQAGLTINWRCSVKTVTAP